ncbi:MAG: hypothetical protein FWC95_08615, partial [Defluviitaleaceae bacterium]|nr:hypothetical protein [Defluviitaleaceae bacterium]
VYNVPPEELGSEISVTSKRRQVDVQNGEMRGSAGRRRVSSGNVEGRPNTPPAPRRMQTVAKSESDKVGTITEPTEYIVNSELDETPELVITPKDRTNRPRGSRGLTPPDQQKQAGRAPKVRDAANKNAGLDEFAKTTPKTMLKPDKIADEAKTENMGEAKPRGASQDTARRGTGSKNIDKALARAESARRLPSLAVILVIAVAVIGITATAFLLNHFVFTNHFNDFESHVRAGDFNAAATLYESRLRDDNEDSARARIILTEIMEEAIQSFASEEIDFSEALSLLDGIRSLHKLDLLDLDAYEFRINTLATSMVDFTVGVQSLSNGDYQAAIRAFGRVSQEHFRFAEAHNQLEFAANNFRNNVIQNLGLDNPYDQLNPDIYENALQLLRDALFVLPNDPTLLAHMDSIQNQLNALADLPVLPGTDNGYDSYEPYDEPPPQVDPNFRANMHFNPSSAVNGYFTGTVNAQGQPHGHGTLVWRETDTERESYVGYWNNGLRHGHGVFRLRSGTYYTGNWANGGFSGQGTLTFYDGIVIISSNWTSSSISNAHARVISPEGIVIHDGVIRYANQRSWSIQ